MVEFIGLKAKMYTYKTEEKEAMKAKGVPKKILKQEYTFKRYHDTSYDTEFNKDYCNGNCLRSYNHEKDAVNITKIALSNCDNKRYYLDNLTSVPYGYQGTKYSIN